MSCPHCAAEVVDGSRFCPACGGPVAAAPFAGARPRQLSGSAAAALAFGGTLAEIRRPGTIVALAIWDFLQGGVLLLAALSVVFVTTVDPEIGALVWVRLAVAVAYGLIGGAFIATGFGLLRMRRWGRILQIVVACFGLLGFPCGTIISIFILVYMLKPGVRILFSEKTGELQPDEAAEVALALQSNSAMWAIVAVAGLLVVVAIIGIVAAIAIPSLLRARISANESAAIGNLRALVEAEGAFASVNGGRYATLECLRQPDTCAAAGRTTGRLPGPMVFDTPSSGYVLRFHPGPAAAADGEAGSYLIESYAISAVPASTQGGVRRFCADDGGTLYVMPEGEGVTEAGHCPASGKPLR